MKIITCDICWKDLSVHLCTWRTIWMFEAIWNLYVQEQKINKDICISCDFKIREAIEKVCEDLSHKNK